MADHTASRCNDWRSSLLLRALQANSTRQAIRQMRRGGAPVLSYVEGASPLLTKIEDSSLETGRPRPASNGNLNWRAKPLLRGDFSYGVGERPHTDLSRKARLGGSVGSAGQLHSASVMADSYAIAKRFRGEPNPLP